MTTMNDQDTLESLVKSSDSSTLGLLKEWEFYWRDNYYWFLERGYRLRPRYHPDWVPSWKRVGGPDIIFAKDKTMLGNPDLNDAIRISDDVHVVLKRSPHTILSFQTQEASIMEYFSEKNRASDARNHCVPCLDVLRPPTDTTGVVIVMPILRDFDNPEFDTVGEGLDFIGQILTGFAFLHEHRVAHRDVRAENLMMDSTSLGIERFHFMHPNESYDRERKARPRKTRTTSRPKYYIIDFGFSSRYQTDDGHPRELVRPATDGSLPELQSPSTLFDPFPIDVYYVGNFIRMEFIDGNPADEFRNGRTGFEFLRPLTRCMTLRNPDQRITMAEAVQKFDDIVSKLDTTTLRGQAKRKHRPAAGRGYTDERILRNVRHFYRRVKYTIARKPPIPI